MNAAVGAAAFAPNSNHPKADVVRFAVDTFPGEREQTNNIGIISKMFYYILFIVFTLL